MRAACLDVGDVVGMRRTGTVYDRDETCWDCVWAADGEQEAKVAVSGRPGDSAE